jgi:hypothetical protein
MLPSRVPGIVRSLARWAVLSSAAAALPACSSPPAAQVKAPVPWLGIACDEGGRLMALDLAELERPVDYASIHRQSVGEPRGIPPTYTVIETGTACFRARNRAACEAEVAAAQTVHPSCDSRNLCPRFLITTEGDQVTRTELRYNMLTLLGTIDDANEAIALALFDGYPIECNGDGPDARGTMTRSRLSGALQRDAVFDLRTKWEDCRAGAVFDQTLHVTSAGKVIDDGEVLVARTSTRRCSTGRRPVGLCLRPASHAALGLGPFLADTARLEAASVYAFERLARELAALSAPVELIAAAARSAQDEVRHARVMTALARSWGGEPEEVHVTPLPLRAPFAIALDNAVEGCVRETHGALIAQHQALAARDPEIRSALTAIAADETRHALLSWQVAHWLEPRLPVAEQAALAGARVAALQELQREREPGLSAHEAALIGWPSARVASALIAQLGHSLQLA